MADLNISICPQPFYRYGLEEGLARIAALGIRAVELPVHAGNPWVRVEELATDAGATGLRRKLADAGLECSALSIHQDAQLLLGPHHADTDAIMPGPPSAKIAHASGQILAAGRAAHVLGLANVVGFVGCEDQWRLFPWPDASGWEKMRPVLRERVGPLLDEYDRLGVNFAQEAHPKQIVYNLETALDSLAILDDHPRWNFNLDPANLLLAGIDPLVYAQELAPRIVNVHAKDGQRVRHNLGRSGLLAHGRWDRPDRGFRFRIVGWGEIDWKGLISQLRLAGYEGWWAIENEDPVFGAEEGVQKALAELQALLPRTPREERWW